MRRVMVVGSSGSGKTTFARALAEKLRLPLVELDRYYWRAGWNEPTGAEWRKSVADLAATPDWVMDGNYSGTFDLRMPIADAIIWLDYPRAICLRRALARTMRGYGRPRDGLTGCPERFDWEFLQSVWEFPSKHRPRIESAIRELGPHARLWQITD